MLTHTMLLKKARKVLGVPIEAGATSYHRVIQPLYELMKEEHPIQFLGEQAAQAEQYDWADVLYIQCLYAPGAYQFYTEQKAKGKLIILDFDDDYINIPKDSPEQTEVIDHTTGEAVRFPPEMRALYVKLFSELADMVVVSTDNLKAIYAPFSKNVKMIPNCVSPEMMRDIAKEKNSAVRILWSGSRSHLPDLQLLVEPLSQIHHKYGNGVEIHLQGSLNFKEIFPNIPIIEHPAVDFSDYLNKIQEINPDISLGPLQANVFNAGKSNLKYCQMSLMESAFVGSQFGPYLCIDHEYDGMLADGPKDWFRSISKLIDNEKLRHTISKNALNTVKANHMIATHLHKWRELLVTAGV